MIKTLLDRITDSVTSEQRTEIYCECRRCGTTVSNDDDVCPRCGTQDIARLELR